MHKDMSFTSIEIGIALNLLHLLSACGKLSVLRLWVFCQLPGQKITWFNQFVLVPQCKGDEMRAHPTSMLLKE